MNQKKSVAHLVVRTTNVIVVNKFGSLKINLYISIMSEEKDIEEILIESHSYGLRTEVMETASKIMGSNPKIRRIDAYQQAFNEWCK